MAWQPDKYNPGQGDGENFEKYRYDFAQKLKNAPKEERRAILEKEKKENPEQFENAKKLKEQKQGFVRLMHTEELDNPEDPKSVANWIEDEVRDYVSEHSLWMEEIFKEIAGYLADRLGVDKKALEGVDISDWEGAGIKKGANFDNDREDAISYRKVILMGHKICEVGETGDFWHGWAEDWDNQGLELACKELLSRLKEFKKEGE